MIGQRHPRSKGSSIHDTRSYLLEGCSEQIESLLAAKHQLCIYNFSRNESSRGVKTSKMQRTISLVTWFDPEIKI